MSKEKIFLGTDRNGDRLWIEKHSWDCEWYWGFGYIGNAHLHTHIDSMIDQKEYNNDWTDVNYQFRDTWISQDQWWILRDLFKAAYALKKAAEVYRYGGHQTNSAAPYRVISEEMATKINADLGKLLDNIWNLLTEWKEENVKNR